MIPNFLLFQNVKNCANFSHMRLVNALLSLFSIINRLPAFVYDVLINV